MAKRTISGPERAILAVFAPGSLLIGLVGGIGLARALDGDSLTSTYWDKLLNIAGVSALPIVAVAVLVLRTRTSDVGVGAGWGASVIVGGLLAFALALLVIMVCLYQIVTTPAAGRVPDSGALWFATVGTGLTLGAVAASVAAAALDKIDD